MSTQILDVFIIGGGINGCGIARDAAGRGLSVGLAEMGDLGGATSSASTKLFHGGLRYLEYFEFRLVREALREREVLLRMMPHISWPMRFILPTHRDMRFEGDTPLSILLGRGMPWLRGQRPAWLIRAGLALYDSMGGRRFLPATTRVDLSHGPEGAPLQDRFTRAFEYSDGWVDDARLVALNARDAATRGARILVRHKVTRARVVDGIWHVDVTGPDGATTQLRARALINAGGPWVADVIATTLGRNARERIRLVRGSHIVTRRLFDHDKSYFLQGEDGRIIFAIPYEQDFTLIGTTDADHPDPDQPPVCTDAEKDYLLDFANRYFKQQLSRDDIVWTYSGVRPLFDDGQSSASAATRDYKIKLEDAGAPLLHVFGGKITTFRKLAEATLAKLAQTGMAFGPGWTAEAPLPGGDFAVEEAAALPDKLRADYPFLDRFWATRLVRAYGREAWEVLGRARSPDDLGRDFGATLHAAEVTWMMTHEFARRAEDVVWRRSKLGLRMSAPEIAALDDWMTGEAKP